MAREQIWKLKKAMCEDRKTAFDMNEGAGEGRSGTDKKGAC